MRRARVPRPWAQSSLIEAFPQRLKAAMKMRLTTQLKEAAETTPHQFPGPWPAIAPSNFSTLGTAANFISQDVLRTHTAPRPAGRVDPSRSPA